MELCKTCLGAGRISCGCCWNGQTRPHCPDCAGTGALPGSDGKVCPRCHGAGRIFPQSCPACGNSVLCPDCEGAGQRG